jgi:hypothetical protein
MTRVKKTDEENKRKGKRKSRDLELDQRFLKNTQLVIYQ